ncbi:MAG: gliding motility-associated C-terminal domain-containing protein [candidate division KSB1 bacterium]|nr:gliding motility-associated C-terminal domain-containing protein [candidate division KSB1 bacterium]
MKITSRKIIAFWVGAGLTLLMIPTIAAQPIPQNNIPYAWNVSLIGRYGFGPCLAASANANGTSAYFGNGAYFEIADISNAANPSRASRLLLPDAIYHIAISSNYAYIANAGAGLRVIDISRPNNPVEQSYLETLGIASGLVISGTRLLIADGPNGLLVIDISIPWQPKQMGAVDSDGWAKKVATDANGYFAYVADQHGGLQVFDITNPYAPARAGKYTTFDGVMDVAISGNFAYVAAGSAGLRVLDISDRYANPIERGALETFQFATAISLKGNYAYLADQETGLWIIDVSRPETPSVVGHYDTAGQPYELALTNNLALVADGANGLRCINVDNFSAPMEISFIETDGFSRGIALEGNSAFLVKREAGIRLIDVADRTNPSRISSLDLSGQAEDVVLNNRLAYLTNFDKGLRIVSFEDPITPKEIGAADQNLSAKRVAIQNDLAYVADPTFGLRIIDISDPFQPSVIRSVELPGKRAEAIAIKDHYAFIAAGDDGLVIFDIHNPSQPVKMGSLSVNGTAISVDVNDHYAYLGTAQNYLWLIDILDPVRPIRIGQMQLISPAFEIVAQQRYLYIANGASGLRVIDVMNPADPKEVGFYVAGSTAYGVAVDQEYVYLSCDETGLFILKFLPLFKNEAPFAPVLVAPLNNSFINQLNPKLSWLVPGDPNNDLLHFKIELDRDGNWGIPDFLVESNKNPTGFSPSPPVDAASGVASYVIQSPLTEGEWFWRVSAFDGMIYGPFSDAWKFTADTTRPKITKLSFLQPGYQENWFNPGQTDSATLIVSYDELYPKAIELAGPILADTLVQIAIRAGINQTTAFHFSIANKKDGNYPIQVSLQDSAGNIGSAVTTIQIDGTAPFGYFSSAPDTIAEGQPYLVQVLGATDSLGCGVAQIFMDVFQDTLGTPTTPRDLMSGQIEPGVYFYSYYAIDHLGNRGIIKTDTTVVTPVYTAVPIFATVSDSEVFAGDSFWVEIQIGNEGEPVENLFQVDLILKYSEPQYVSVDSIVLGNLFGSSAILSYQFDIPDGQISIKISQPPGQIGVNGYGSLAAIQFFSDDNTPDQSEIQFSIPTTSASDPDDYPIPLLASGTSIRIVQPLRDFLMNVVPDTQMVFPGDSAKFDVSLTPVGVFDFPVTLSILNVPEGIQAIYPNEPISIPATQTIIFATTEALVPGDYSLIITAFGGGISHSDTIFINVQPRPIPPDFIMIVQPDSQNIYQGDSADVTLSFQPIGDFDSYISVSVSNLPSGMSVSLPVEPFTIPNQVKLTFATDSEILPGPYSPIIAAAGGGITHLDTVTIIVNEKIVQPDFSISVVPDSQTIYQGESAVFEVSLAPIGQWTDAVILTISNIPDGMFADYPKEPFSIPAILNVTFSTTPEIVPGSYQPVIGASDGGITHQDTVTIVVLQKVVPADFSMSVVPDSQSIYQGETATFQLSFEPIGDFSAAISLQITDLPLGMRAQYPSEPFAIPTSFAIAFSTATDIEPGVYYPVITATGGGITHQTRIAIRVLQRMDFIMIIEPDSQAVVVGEHIQFFISFIPVGGFDAQITVSVSNVPEGMEARYTSRPFSIPFSISLEFWVPRNFPQGLYYPTVTATGGGITHQETVVVNVLPRQGTIQQFSVLPNPFTPNNDGFNDYTEFQIQDAISGDILISIFDISGRKIIDLKNSFIWAGLDDRGKVVKPGAYIYIVKQGSKVIAKGIISIAR